MRRAILTISFLLLIVSCLKPQPSCIDAEINGDDVESRRLLLPVIPDSITDIRERAGYAVMHFWDSIDFADRVSIGDSFFMEQNFSNFIAVLPLAAPEIAENAVKKLLTSAATDSLALACILKISDDYLDNADSPMRDEITYIMFLRVTSQMPQINVAAKEYYRFRLGMALKNRPGSKAPDFDFVDRDGARFNLHTALARDTTIVMFYDSDCGNCMETIKKMSAPDVRLGYKVLAVDVAGDKNKWDTAKYNIPSDWLAAFALESVEDNDKYYFAVLPTFYLLAPDATIVIKDMNPDTFR